MICLEDLEERDDLVNRDLKRNDSANNQTNFRKPEQTKAVHIWLRLLILVLIVGGLTFIIYETGVIQFFLNKKRMAHFLNSVGPWSEVVFVLLQIAQVIAAPIPGEVTGFLGGYVFGKFLGVVLSTVGLTIGSYLAFILARTFGRPLIEKFVPNSTMQRFDYLLHHKAAFLVFLLFLTPGFPKDWLCYILGLGHLSTAEFLVIGGTGRLFGTILLTLGGSYLRHHQYLRFYILAGIGISVVIVALAYRDKLDRIFRFWHLKGLRKRRQMEVAQRNMANH
jgi:uncharacterized membrane protein YdjX (TVP38/TMEM64 family)